MTLAGRILPNGTFIGMVKVHGKTGSEAHLVVANDWSNPNGYVRNGGPSFAVKSLLEGCTVTPLRRYAIRWREWMCPWWYRDIYCDGCPFDRIYADVRSFDVTDWCAGINRPLMVRMATCLMLATTRRTVVSAPAYILPCTTPTLTDTTTHHPHTPTNTHITHARTRTHTHTHTHTHTFTRMHTRTHAHTHTRTHAHTHHARTHAHHPPTRDVASINRMLIWVVSKRVVLQGE